MKRYWEIRVLEMRCCYCCSSGTYMILLLLSIHWASFKKTKERYHYATVNLFVLCHTRQYHYVFTKHWKIVPQKFPYLMGQLCSFFLNRNRLPVCIFRVGQLLLTTYSMPSLCGCSLGVSVGRYWYLRTWTTAWMFQGQSGGAVISTHWRKLCDLDNSIFAVRIVTTDMDGFSGGMLTSCR